MKTVKIVKLSQQEIEELTKAHASQDNPELSLEDILKENDNQTLTVLKQIKNIYEWKDIENMVDYVSIMKKFYDGKEEVELDNDEYKLAIEVFQGAVKSGKVNGFGLEKMVQVYSEFKKAS